MKNKNESEEDEGGDHNASNKTVKKIGGRQPEHLGFYKRAKGDGEIEEIQMEKYRETVSKCLLDLRKEETGLGFEKITKCRNDSNEGVAVLDSITHKATEMFLCEFTRLVEQINEVSVWFIKQKNFEKASEVLEKCFYLVKSQPYVFIECYLSIRNNQAYLWKFVGKRKKALSYLLKAENILERNPDVNHGVTFLSMSVIYSQLKE